MGDTPKRSVRPPAFTPAVHRGTPSQIPGDPDGGDALLALILRNVTASGRVYRELLDRLAHITLAPGTAAIYESLFDREKCLVRGRGIATPPLLSDAVVVFSAAVPEVLRAPLPGFGPMRLKFALERVVEHHQAWLRVVHLLGQKASASAGKSTSVGRARKDRSLLKGLLASATPASGSLRATFDGQVETGARTPVELVSSIQSLQVASEALLQRGEQSAEWATALEDMGISREVIEKLAGGVDAVTAHGRTHRASRSDLKHAWDALNTLDGITWFHLEETVRAFERARHLGRTVPHVALDAVEAVRKGRVRVADESVNPPPPDAPANPPR